MPSTKARNAAACRRLRFIALGLLAMALLVALPAVAQPEAVDGRLDLSAWDFVQDGPAALVGEWRFYWQELLAPYCTASHSGALQRLPNAWAGAMWDGRELPGLGHATYCLRVILPPDRTAPLVLSLPRVRTSGALWVNGNQVAISGQVGVDPRSSRPQRIDQLVTIAPQRELQIVLQVSNYHFRTGGADKPLLLGDSLSDFSLLTSAPESVSMAFFLGAFLMLGLYHLLIYGPRRPGGPQFYFGLLCIAMALYQLTRANNLFAALIGLPWAWEIRFEYILFSLMVALGASFLRTIYPKDVPRRLPDVAWTCTAVFVLSVILTPTRISSQWLLTAYQVVFAGLAVWGCLCMLKAIAAQRPGSRWFVIGAVLWIGAGLFDAVASRVDVSAPRMLPFGFLAMVVTQAVLLAIAQTRRGARARDLSSRLLTLASEKLALEQEVMRDPLTGLANRRQLEQSAELLITQGTPEPVAMRTASDPDAVSLLYIDINHFKSINDAHGHDVGDEVLVMVAEKIREQVRSYDLSSRFGGDEFVVLAPGLDSAGARELAARLRHRIETALLSRGFGAPVGIAVGTATDTVEGFSLESLLRRADQEMYRDKKASRPARRGTGEFRFGS